MRKILVLLSLLLLAVWPVAAQEVTLVKPVVDVGKTAYQQPVTAIFEFQVKGDGKVSISDVRPDCSCTVVEYTRGEVDEKFQIRMTYDARQLGHFNKQAAVVTSASDKPVYITMKGVVLEEVQNFSGTYPVTMGNLLLDKDNLEFDDINKGSVLVQEIHLMNNGSSMCQPNLMHLPSYLQATTTPEQIAPGKEGKIIVTLNSADLRDYGLTQSSVYLAENPGDKVSPDHEIPLSAVLLPAFTDLTEAQKLEAPKLQLSKDSIDVAFEGKSKKSDVIEITNGGQSDLTISSLQMFTGGLQISLNKRKLHPGEMAKLKVTVFRDDIKKVRTRPRILMISNDPDKSKVTININVKE